MNNRKNIYVFFDMDDTLVSFYRDKDKGKTFVIRPNAIELIEELKIRYCEDTEVKFGIWTSGTQEWHDEALGNVDKYIFDIIINRDNIETLLNVNNHIEQEPAYEEYLSKMESMGKPLTMMDDAKTVILVDDNPRMSDFIDALQPIASKNGQAIKFIQSYYFSAFTFGSLKNEEAKETTDLVRIEKLQQKLITEQINSDNNLKNIKEEVTDFVDKSLDGQLDKRKIKDKEIEFEKKKKSRNCLLFYFLVKFSCFYFDCFLYIFVIFTFFRLSYTI